MNEQRELLEIVRYTDGEISFQTDAVVREFSFSLIVNGLKIVTLACLDDQLEELGVGFLFTEGLLDNYSQIVTYKLCSKRERLEVVTTLQDTDLETYLGSVERTTGCGGGISGTTVGIESRTFPKLPLDFADIPAMMLDFQKMSKLFKETGGVHSAALVKDNKVVFFAEDIGRHNAVDKVIGGSLLGEKVVSDYHLLVSGRISSEIVRKAIRMKIPLIISQAAPTSRGISLAWRSGLYLIGFARGKRFNIYTGLNELIRGKK